GDPKCQPPAKFRGPAAADPPSHAGSLAGGPMNSVLTRARNAGIADTAAEEISNWLAGRKSAAPPSRSIRFGHAGPAFAPRRVRPAALSAPLTMRRSRPAR